MKHKTRTKALSWLLSLALVLGLLPGMGLTALAAGGTSETIATNTGATSYTGNMFSVSFGRVEYSCGVLGEWSSEEGTKYSVSISISTTEQLDRIEMTIQKGRVFSNSNVTFSGGTGTVSGNKITITNITSKTIVISNNASGEVALVQSVTLYPKIPVTGVTLSPSDAQSVTVGDNIAFTATIAPDGATDKTVKWSTTGGVTLYSDSNCTSPITAGTAISTLTVYAKGTSAGSATVTVTTNDGSKTASCNVTVHAHSFTYSADGATITATCSNSDGKCDLTGNVATLTIAAPPADNPGAGAQITDEVKIQGDAVVSYFNADESGNKIDVALEEVPTAFGKYRAEITLGTGTNTATAFVVYTIAQANLTDTSTTWRIDSTIADDVTISSSVTVTADITLTIPEGKTLTVNGGINANGHTLTVDGAGTLNVTGTNGGNGSNGGYEGNGGNGGNGNAGFTGTLVVDGTVVNVTGGNGGNGGNGGRFEGNGGNGGIGGNGVSGDVTVRSGSATMTGGYGGNGGNVDQSMNRYGRAGSAGSVGRAVSGSITATTAEESTDNSTWTAIAGTASTKRYVKAEGPTHTHSFTYSTDGATITATCAGTDAGGFECPLENHTATLAIVAPTSLAYDGTVKEAKVTGTIPSIDTPSIAYTKGGETVGAANVKEAGTYIASITLTGVKTAISDSADVTASVEFTITNLEYDVTPLTGLVGGTVTANKDKAKYGETITLGNTPDSGFTFVSYSVTKTGDSSTTVTVTDGTFSMPAYPVTVSATFEGDPFGITTICDPAIGGTVGKTGSGVVTADNTTTAKAGTEVMLTANAATGFTFDSFTVKTAGGETVTVTDGKFTMPTEAVTVTATFVGKDTTATLTVDGSGGTAALLDDSYNEVKSLTKKAGEEFILLVNKDDGYDYNVKFGSEAASLTEFTKEQYEAYLTHAKANSISVPMNMALMWVTMPGVSADSVNATVTFSKLKTFTVLYQPTDNPTEVWCRIGITSNNQEHFDAAKMKSDSEMGGTTVWSVKVTAAFYPTKVGFFTSKADAEASGATVSNAVTSQSANSWNDVTGGKYIIIGGDAKTVIAAFVDDANALTVYDSETVSFDYAKSSTGVRYQIAVCQTDPSGNVTTAGSLTAASAPATAPERKTFDKWSVLEGTAPNKTEKRYEAGQPNISIAENTIFTAVWKPEELTVTLNLNGGTGVDTPKSVIYGNKLEISEPTRGGYVFDGWKVNKAVSENGKLFAKGSTFDLDTPITAYLELTAQWKHVHSYSYYKISDFPSLSAYQSYEDYIHVAVCGCGDIKLEAHNLDSNGACACGYGANQSDEVTLKTSFGQMSGDFYTQKMAGKDRTEKKEQEVTVYAPSSLGDSLQFSKWVFTIDDGTTWYDLSTSTMVSFVIPCDMQLRALYINPVTQPQVELSARSYDYPYQNTTVDAILFQMNYKLPDGYTFVDAGVRLGDNQGISYYELKEKTISMTAETQAIATGFAVVTSFLGQSINTFDTSASEKFYDKRENNVLDEMSAATLAEYMYESKPVNVEKYEPIYWETKATTKGLSGSINSLAPLRFAQKNNGDHYIYGIGWMRYKGKDGNIQTIYTPALPTTLNGVLANTTGTVTKSGS